MTNSNPNDFIVCMYGYIRRAQYGEWRNTLYRQRKSLYKRTYTQAHRGKWLSHCPECKQRMTKKIYQPHTYTIDHIIPLWVCREYNMPQLEFDLRNFRVLCSTCNTFRGHKEFKWEDLKLSEELKASILRQSAAWERTRAELSTDHSADVSKLVLQT